MHLWGQQLMPKKELGWQRNMEEKKKTKQELLDYIRELADKHEELKIVIKDMVNELDRIELEYIKAMDEIKKN